MGVAGQGIVDFAVIGLRAHADALLGGLTAHHQRTVLGLGFVELGLKLGQIRLVLLESFLGSVDSMLAAFDFRLGLLLGGQSAAGEVFATLVDCDAGLLFPVVTDAGEVLDLAIHLFLVCHGAGR